MMKKVFFLLLALIGTTGMSAQENVNDEDATKEGITSELSVDFMSQYLWRGLDNGRISIQPTLGLAYKGLSLSAWGNMGFEKSDQKEIDLILNYAIGGFEIGLIDYWFGEGSYFRYSNDNTTHVFEANVGYDFGFLALKWYTNFAGDDGKNNDEKRAYSSYFEITAPFSLATLDWEATVGLVPYATTYYDTEGFACTNVSITATKDLKISKSFHLPVSAGLVFNPNSEKAYMFCGLSLKL